MFFKEIIKKFTLPLHRWPEWAEIIKEQDRQILDDLRWYQDYLIKLQAESNSSISR
jgi:hypothetical protein